MPQSLPQRVALSVLESVITALKAAPIKQQETAAPDPRQRAFAVLQRLGIEHLALDALGRLSGGQRQLASLAQALVREPRVLLLDEPTSALDLGNQFKVMELVQKLARERNMVVLVVMHDMNLAARWADRIVLLSRGAVVAAGTPEAALTPAALKQAYDVEARIERCSKGRLQIFVDRA